MSLDLPVVIWTLTKGARIARCEVGPHPCGLELRCTVDGEMRRTQAFRDAEALKLEAHAWLEAFGATGWTIKDSGASRPLP